VRGWPEQLCNSQCLRLLPGFSTERRLPAACGGQKVHPVAKNGSALAAGLQRRAGPRPDSRFIEPVEIDTTERLLSLSPRCGPTFEDKNHDEHVSHSGRESYGVNPCRAKKYLYMGVTAYLLMHTGSTGTCMQTLTPLNQIRTGSNQKELVGFAIEYEEPTASEIGRASPSPYLRGELTFDICPPALRPKVRASQTNSLHLTWWRSSVSGRRRPAPSRRPAA